MDFHCFYMFAIINCLSTPGKKRCDWDLVFFHFHFHLQSSIRDLFCFEILNWKSKKKIASERFFFSFLLLFFFLLFFFLMWKCVFSHYIHIQITIQGFSSCQFFFWRFDYHQMEKKLTEKKNFKHSIYHDDNDHG